MWDIWTKYVFWLGPVICFGAALFVGFPVATILAAMLPSAVLVYFVYRSTFADGLKLAIVWLSNYLVTSLAMLLRTGSLRDLPLGWLPVGLLVGLVAIGAVAGGKLTS